MTGKQHKLKSKIYDSPEREDWYIGNYTLHRPNGLPAVMYANGSEFYFENGEYHRDHGPAYLWHNKDGSFHKQYYLHGKKVDEHGREL